MEHWDLATLDVEPHKPQVLHSTRGEGRSIALHLPAGEELQDHQVHERANQGPAGQAKTVNGFNGIRAADPGDQPGRRGRLPPRLHRHRDDGREPDRGRPGRGRRRRRLRRGDRLRRDGQRHRARGHRPHRAHAARRAGLADQPGRRRRTRTPSSTWRRSARSTSPPWADDVPAILWSSYNGQRKGEALADVLLGDAQPERPAAVDLVPRRRPDPEHQRLPDPPAGRQPGPHAPVLRRRPRLPVRLRAELHRLRLREPRGRRRDARRRRHRRRSAST